MKKRALSLPFAIMTIFVMALLGVLSFNIFSQQTKIVSDDHIKNQMRLYRDSAIELTLLWLSGDYNRSKDANALTDHHDLNITFDNSYYFYITVWESSLDLIPETNGTVVIDIIGETSITGEKIRITHRSVQKP